MAAKVLVKRLVGAGLRPGPAAGLLVLPRHEVEMWFDKEAVKFLKEQKEARQRPIAVL